jgi:hypothetical protein
MKHAAWWVLVLLFVVPGWTADSDNGEPFGQPFTKEIQLWLDPNVMHGEGTSFTVPADKTLIIEFVTVWAALEAEAAKATFASIRTTLGGQPHEHYILMSRQGTFGAELFVATQPLRIYAEAGSTVNCFFGRNNNLGVPVAVTTTVTGRLISN